MVQQHRHRAPSAPQRGPALGPLIADTLDAALGRTERHDEILGRSGGPRGNALLTAWTGLLLLVLLAAEGLTIVAIGPLLTWHIILGAVLIPPVLLKTASTGWRIVGYYTRRAPYVVAGPPPLLLRLLGPLVVVTSMVVLATGVVLILVGRDSGRSAALGVPVSWLTLHKVSFVLWFAVMTAHVLARTVPALRSARESVRGGARVPGGAFRAAGVLASVVAGVALAVVLVRADHWTRQDGHDGQGRPGEGLGASSGQRA